MATSVNTLFLTLTLLVTGARPALAACPSNLLDRVQHFDPQVLIVLGAGFERHTGLPARHSQLRARTAERIFFESDTKPELLFSGGVRGAHRTMPPTPAELNCWMTRVGFGSNQVAPSHLTEADVLCGLVALNERWTPRLWFETFSTSTWTNARYSANRIAESPTLRSATRVLIVTSQVMRHGRVVDDHAQRSYRAFRSNLSPNVRVAALGCTPEGERGSRLITD